MEHAMEVATLVAAASVLWLRVDRVPVLVGLRRLRENRAPEAFRMAARIDHGTTTQLLNRLSAGDSEAANELAPLVYSELHHLAGGLLARGAHATLQPTALVHEAWLRFAGEESSFENRFQFYALAAKVMRSVLVDHARAREAQKRGGKSRQVTWIDAGGVEEPPIELLDLDEALHRLEALDTELFRIVELRFFGGLTHAEIARILEISVPTIERRWRLARAWLHTELRP